MPLSLQVGVWLSPGEPDFSADVPRHQSGPRAGGPVADLPEPTGVLVMGDGSARRSLKGPGYLDDRAERFDATVVMALADGSPQSLAALDLELAHQLLAAGALLESGREAAR